jgi:sporulation protein YlmC with PRC-barrel domain
VAARFGHDSDRVRELLGGELLGLPVRLHGVQLGRPADLLLDRELLRVVGLDLLCGDEVHRFLPLPTATVSEREIAIRSPLVLLEEDELDFYRSRAFTLSSLRGRSVEHNGVPVGTLSDVVVANTGELLALIVQNEGKTQRISFDSTIRLVPASRSAA